MRIISGKFGGRRFNPPGGLSARPTTDRAKEGLFNWLQHRMDLDGISFLDLFSGTGNIAFELVSRGAIGTAVERDRKATAFIEKTARDLQLGPDELTVVTGDVDRYLNSGGGMCDLVFADPPYAISDPLHLVRTVFDKQWIKPGGYLILEHYDKVVTDHAYRIEQRKYGQSVFSIFMAPVAG